MAYTHGDKALVKEAVLETLLAFGIDVSNPEGVVNFQQDMHYLRSSRLREKGVQNITLHQGVVMVMSALGAAAILGAAKFFGISV